MNDNTNETYLYVSPSGIFVMINGSVSLKVAGCCDGMFTEGTEWLITTS